VTSVTVLMSDGRQVFQTLGPATVRPLLPTVESLSVIMMGGTAADDYSWQSAVLVDRLILNTSEGPKHGPWLKVKRLSTKSL